MKETEFPAFLSENTVLIFISVIVMLFSAFSIFLMIKDYLCYMEEHWNKKYSFTDFAKREQSYIYIMLFFFVLTGMGFWISCIE